MGLYNTLVGKIFGADTQRAVDDVQLDPAQVSRDVIAGARAEVMAAVSARLVCVDTSNVIASVNPAALAMFREAQADLRLALPGFTADTLPGSSIEVLLRNEPHMLAQIAGLTRSQAQELVVGTRTFELLVSPVFSDDKTRLGTVIEWTDVTLARKHDAEEIARVTDARRVAAENLRIRIALDHVTSNVMLADKDNRIAYANHAVVEMLQAAEAHIRKDLGNFNSNALLGQPLEIFCKDTALRQSLLNTANNTNRVQFELGSRTFIVTTNPVTDKDGSRLGTVIEWKDKTDEIDFENTIHATINHALNGNLDHRIDVQSQSGNLVNIAVGINKVLGIFQNVIAETGTAVASLAEGNLNRKIAADFQGSYANLKADINNTIDKLVEVVTNIRESAVNVKTGASEISSGNTNLSQRTEEQAASLEETSAAMEQITTTVQHNASNAIQANTLARGARESAENGGDVVNKAISAMQAINDSSNKINDIISVIDEIAFQTNLLALNAAVEAARAGDQGRGFAVVADEVRNLAGRSATAAKEIKELIKDSNEKVREGSRLVNKSGVTLGEIVTAVKKVNDIVAEISTASEEQATGLDEINRAVGEMDSMTQQNAALVEQAAAASEALGTQAETLEALIGFFQIENSAPVERRMVVRAPAARATKPSAHAARKKAVSPAAVARKSHVALDEDDKKWAEF
jgi:methyl-accepting chemotaxis protein